MTEKNREIENNQMDAFETKEIEYGNSECFEGDFDQTDGGIYEYGRPELDEGVFLGILGLIDDVMIKDVESGLKSLKLKIPVVVKNYATHSEVQMFYYCNTRILDYLAHDMLGKKYTCSADLSMLSGKMVLVKVRNADCGCGIDVSGITKVGPAF